QQRYLIPAKIYFAAVHAADEDRRVIDLYAVDSYLQQLPQQLPDQIRHRIIYGAVLFEVLDHDPDPRASHFYLSSLKLFGEKGFWRLNPGDIEGIDLYLQEHVGVPVGPDHLPKDCGIGPDID